MAWSSRGEGTSRSARTEWLAIKEIARRLVIRAKTADIHRLPPMERQGIYDISRFVRYAIRAGLVVQSD